MVQARDHQVEKDPHPVTYDPSQLIVRLGENGGDKKTYVHINSCEVTPIDDDEYTTEKASTGQRAWIRNPEYGGEMTIEFSGGLAGYQRKNLRDLKGKFVDASAHDQSGTKDSVSLVEGRIVQMPDFSRDDSEPTMELVIQSPFADWGAESN